jgi:GH43 family beta-xylosidase
LTSTFSQETFHNPIKTGAADPQIYYHDGWFYFLFTTGDGVWVRKHQELHRVGEANGVKVWGWEQDIKGHVWAPEIAFIDGKWYIYASGSITGSSNPESMRMFVLEAATSNPQGSYIYRGLLSNKYAIDQSVWKDPDTGILYMTWSQWDQNIPMATPEHWIQTGYIGTMHSPTQLATAVRISYPEHSWEKHGWWVNEGQYFLKQGNKLHIVYSASGCATPEYSLALLTCENGDYLNPSCWKKSNGPVFTQNPQESVYGTGHHSTIQLPNGEWWLAYHAVSNSSGACDGTRSTRIQPFTFDGNDYPVFGKPVATSVALSVPGSISPPNYWNFDSSLEGWNTPMNLTATASNGLANLTVTNADPYIHSPNNLNISASDHKYVIISMQNQTNSSTAELFWITTTATAYDGAKRVSFPIIPNDSKQRTYIIDLSANSNWNGTIKQIRLDPTIASSGAVKIDFIKFSGAYPNTISAVPGTIEAENFNKGGNNNAYFDKDIVNQGGQYRTSESVDIQTASSGGYNVGWAETDEWLEYLVKVNATGNYSLSLEVASVTNSNSIKFYLNGETLGSAFTVNNTGGLQTYTQLSQNVTLTAGVHLIKLFVQHSNGGLNINSFTFTGLPNALNSPSNPITNANWVATDALARTIPDYSIAGASRENKHVGMFYYIWHNNAAITDISKALAENPTNPVLGNRHAFHFWGEPEAGYYRADDPWVIRRNMQMLANAGVDFIFFDVTNAITYLSTVDSVCKVISQMRSEGIPAPYISFTTNSSSGVTMNALYDSFYALDKYKDLWFIWQGKPLIMGKATDAALRSEVKNFFTIKRSWAWTNPADADSWQWLDTYPQDYGWTASAPGVAEQITVTTASHPTNNIGKSFNGTTQPATDQYGITPVTDQGIYFAKQWERALEVDPQLVMITQWNEWLAQRFVCSADGCQPMLGKPTTEGQSWFVDVYNREYNRDMEPMKGEWTDNYYYQMLANVRKYKGMEAPQSASSPKNITVDGTFTEWNTVTPVFTDPIGDTRHRNHPRFDSKANLVNTTGRNDITESRTTIDGSNVYFYIKTAANITPHTDPNWMMVYLNTDRNKTTGWEGFDYVINMGVTSATETTIKKRIGSSWTTVGAATYKVVGNQMEIAVPRSVLEYTTSNVAYYYQIFDNPQVLDNIEDNFVHGESAPDRRFNYSYENTAAYASPISITPHSQINGGDWLEQNTATLCAGGTVSFGPHPVVTTGWSWIGPNGFIANTRAITFNNAQYSNSGTYTATYTDAYSNMATQDFILTIHELPSATITTQDATNSENNGEITFNFNDNPNRTNIAFSINDGANYTSIADNSGSYTFGDLATGVYPVWTRWGNADCLINLGSYTIESQDSEGPVGTFITPNKAGEKEDQGNSQAYDIHGRKVQGTPKGLWLDSNRKLRISF